MVMKRATLTITALALCGSALCQIAPPGNRQGTAGAGQGAGFGGSEGRGEPRPPVRSRAPIRIPVRSADPYTIVALLQGTPIVSPEMSTLFGFAGVPQQATNQINGFFAGGKFMVNPTDNSIWWLPD